VLHPARLRAGRATAGAGRGLHLARARRHPDPPDARGAADGAGARPPSRGRPRLQGDARSPARARLRDPARPRTLGRTARPRSRPRWASRRADGCTPELGALAERAEAHAVEVAAARRRLTAIVAAPARIEEADAGADRALAVGVGVERLAAGALDEGEAPNPLGPRRRGPLRADPARTPVAELVAVERVPQVEELRAGSRRRGAHRGDYRARPFCRRPVGVAVPDRAAALAEPAPAHLRIADPAPRGEGGRVPHRHQPVIRTTVAGGGHRGMNPAQRLRHAPLHRRQRDIDVGLGGAATERGVLLGAARPVQRTARYQLAEADIVGANGKHDHPHLVAPGYGGQLIRLWRLAEVPTAVHRRRPDVRQPRARAGEVDLLRDWYRRTENRRYVGAVAVVLLRSSVDPPRVVLADPAITPEGSAIGSGPGPKRFRAVAEPAPALAGDEAVPHRDNRRRSRASPRRDW